MKKEKKVKSENGSRKLKGNWFYFAIKRIFDLFWSFIAILLLSLVLLGVAIAVKCSSKGPAIFADKRVGKNGKQIKVLKFRSMYIDAESNIDKYLTPEQKEIWLRERKLDNDPRITKVGRFIRKTSLDELPQLFNIFIGTMSFVGTRPITRRELETHFTEEEQKILISGKPGLTGYWQVYGRGEAEYDTGERQKLELKYFYRRGLFFDLKLLFLTVPAVLKHKGAK
jgi:lipopolysaccharide/colanic/teichoic acid biosynthesis glycosyltransferase